MYVKCGLLTRAAEEAFKLKDVSLLESLRDKIATASSSASAPGQQGAALEVERMIARLRPGK